MTSREAKRTHGSYHWTDFGIALLLIKALLAVGVVAFIAKFDNVRLDCLQRRLYIDTSCPEAFYELGKLLAAALAVGPPRIEVRTGH